MMTQSHRGKGAWLRLAATLPAIAATFFAFGCGTKQAEITEVTTDLTDGTEATYIDMCPPCDATVSNTFNAGRAGHSHTGIDYVLDEGDPVYASADGEISSITRDDSNGLMLVLRHSDGFETRYAHLSKVDIASKISFKGKNSGHEISGNSYHVSTTADHTGWTYNGKVFKGQLIGYAGSTGRATGAHLHFELRQHDIPVDPSPFFTSDKPVKAPFMISIREMDSGSGKEYVIFCNGKQTPKDQIGNAAAEFFEGEENKYSVSVLIAADENIPMGVITDVKEQLRNAQALRVRYE
jgi:biopolymer transport protein ExbD